MIDEDRIFKLLERRDECRRRKDWRGADRLKDELSDAFNVVVNDKDRSWTIRAPPSTGTPSPNGGGRFTGSNPAVPPSAGQFRGAMAPPSPQLPPKAAHDYTRSMSDHHPVDVACVDDLIAARMNAKITRDFDRADQVRMELRQLGVEVHDRVKTWFVDRPELALATVGAPPGASPGMPNGMGYMGGSGAGYQCGGGGGGGGGDYQGGGCGSGYQGGVCMGAGMGAGPPMHEVPTHDYRRDPNNRVYLPNEAHVHMLIAERLQAKKSRDFAKADAMRETLLQAGVEVVDRDKIWR